MPEYNINWDKPTQDLSTSVVIGEVSFAPNITFTIRRHERRWNLELQKDVWETDFAISHKIHGISSAVVVKTRDDVLHYLDRQQELLPQYLVLIGEGEKLSERIKTLQFKYYRCSKTIYDLAKQK